MSVNVGTAVGYLDLDTSKFKSALKDAQKQLSSFSDDTLKASDKFTNVGNGLKTIGSALTKTVTVPLLAVGAASTKTAVDFESAFAGVKKTVDATDAELAKLGQGIRDMAKEMPPAATEIAGVAEAAGQLGIKTPNILDFTKTMVMLGDSTNMSAEEAATSLARLANITGMSQKDFDKLGSTIVDLGNNMATTESEITAMGLRLAGAGSQIGLTEAQTMSFAAALSSVGIEAEAGGSAFSKVMVDMQLATEKGGKKLEQFASVAGMSASEFKTAFETDASGAIIAFIKGLGDAESKGQSAIGILDEMGISEVRLRDTLLRAAGASDVFSEALSIGTNAWEENSALTNEAAQRYETLQSKMGIMKNKLTDVGITIGTALMPFLESLVTKIGEVADWFSNLDSSTQGVILTIAGVAAAIGPLLIVIGQMSIGIGALIPIITTLATAFKTNLIASVISLNMTLSTTIIPALTSFGSMLSGMVMSAIGAVSTFLTGTLIPALTATAFSIGAVTVPVWAVIAAFAALVAAGVLVYKNWDTIKAKCIEIWQNNIKPIIEGVTNTTKAFLTATWNGIKAFLETCWNLLKQLATSVWNGIKTIIETVCNTIKNIITNIWNAIKNTITTVVNVISSIISSVFSSILNIITTYVNAWKSIITTVWNSISNIVNTCVTLIRSIIQSAFSAIQGIISSLSNGWKTTIQASWNGIKSIVQTGANAVKSTISSVWSGLQELLIAPFRAAQSVISSILSGISSAISSVKSAISSVKSAASNVIDTINPFKKSVEISYAENPIDAYSMSNSSVDMVKRLVYSDSIAKASIADSIVGVSNLVNKDLIKGNDIKGSSSNSVVINNTYNSPKPASIRELKRQDEIQMRRLAMQLGF